MLRGMDVNLMKGLVATHETMETETTSLNMLCAFTFGPNGPNTNMLFVFAIQQEPGARACF